MTLDIYRNTFAGRYITYVLFFFNPVLVFLGFNFSTRNLSYCADCFYYLSLSLFSVPLF